MLVWLGWMLSKIFADGIAVDSCCIYYCVFSPLVMLCISYYRFMTPSTEVMTAPCLERTDHSYKSALNADP